MNSTLSFVVCDEIALEGLDGITLDSLWLRLESRNKFIEKETGKKCLPKLTEQFKEKIFQIILSELGKSKLPYFISIKGFANI